MEAILLAGGYGTRLKPLTYTRPKSLLPILNEPMVSYLIKKLPKEVDRVILAANYRKDMLERHFKENDPGLEVIINDEPFPMGTGGATKNAEKYVTGTFLVLNSDVLCSLDLSKMVEHHRKKRAMATISLWPVENVSEFGVVRLERDGRITRFVEKPRPKDAPSNLINAGAYCLEKEVLDQIPPSRFVSIEKEIFPKIIAANEQFQGYRFKGYWIDVGRVENYLEANRMLLLQRKMEHVLGNGSRMRGEVISSCVGNNCNVNEGAYIEDSVLFDNVHVRRGAFIVSSVVGEGCEIGACSRVEDCAVGDSHVIGAGKKLIGMQIWERPVPRDYPEKQIGNVVQ